MQAQRRLHVRAKFSYLRVVVAILLTSLVLAACAGGGSGGSSWFNLPSIPLSIDGNGNLSALGFNVMRLDSGLTSQLQAIGAGQLEVRVGYDGLFIFADNQPLPALTWDDGAFDTLDALVRSPALAPYLASAGLTGDTISSSLPWLRRLGVGVVVTLPGGSTANTWDGSAPQFSAQAAADPIGPFNIGAVSLGENGLSVAGVPLSALGVNVPIPPIVGQLFQGLNANQFSLNTRANGLTLQAGSRSLPGLSYDSASLGRAMSLAGAFMGDDPMLGQIESIVTRLPGSSISATVAVGNEPAGPTSLSPIPLQITESGQLSVYGFPVAALPADLISDLQAAGVEQLNVSIEGTTINLAVNGAVLPAISWGDAGPGFISTVAQSLGGLDPALVGGGLDILNRLAGETAIGVALALPGSTPAEMPDFPAVDVSPVTVDAAGIQLGVGLRGGAITSLAGLSVESLAGLGVALPELPSDITGLLGQLNMDQLQVVNVDGRLVIQGDGEVILSIAYGDSLDGLLSLLGSLGLGDLTADLGPFLPLLTGQSLNLVVGLDGGALPATTLSDLSVAITEQGGLNIFGADLGLGNIVPGDILALLQNANLQDVRLTIQDDRLFLGVNGVSMPSIGWQDDALSAIGGALAGLLPIDSALLDTGLGLLANTNLGANVSLPAGAGMTAINVPAGFDPTAVTFTPAQVNPADRPVIRATVTIENGQISAIGSQSAAQLPFGLPALPGVVMDILGGLGYEQISLVMLENDLQVQGNGQTLISIGHDAETLANVLAVAAPFLPEPFGSRLQDPAQLDLVQNGLLPLFVGSDLNVTVNLP
jgi:hypothetical protein